MSKEMDLDNRREPVEQTGMSMLGTLEIDGVGIYSLYYRSTRSAVVWVLMEREVFNQNLDAKARQDCLVAVLRSKSSGKLEGWGATHYITRMLDNLGEMMYKCVNLGQMTTGFINKGSYTDNMGNLISFESWMGSSYKELALSYEGFRVNASEYRGKLPLRLPSLEPVIDQKSKAAVMANLGAKTAAALMKRMGDRLDWFKKKNYKLIDTKEKFEALMLDFLRDVQVAHDNRKRVLIGLDTETTGLNMLNLSDENQFKDHIVAIPFGWRENEGYVICTDMYYFSNVEGEDIYPLFNQLFRRNDDFTFQDIELDYGGEHFSFSRMNITVGGFNAFFDEKAFFCHDCDVFYDEDGLILFYNLDTDFVQGSQGREETGSVRISNSLKSQTRRLVGDETLELEELYGAQHKDKYRYLQDAVLALMYGGADADYTRIVIRKAIEMTEPVLYKQYLKYDMTILYMLARASWHGMPIDEVGVREQGKAVADDLEALKEFIYHYAYLANKDTLNKKSAKLQEMLGVAEDFDVVSELDEERSFRYPFTPANHKKLLFGMLGYPVVKRNDKSGEPAMDKFVLKKLMSKKREQPVEVLTQSLMSTSDPNIALIDKDEFNSDAFPLARVFSTYATLNKEYTSYYKPIIENDMEGKMFYNFTMARAATRRILSPGQTMKGSLKSLVIAPPGKMFMSFDASQIEYRHMSSLAYLRSRELLKKKYPADWESRLADTAVAKICAMMHREEADYHIETAATMTGVRQHEVTPKVRKMYKSIGFGIPYGLGDRSMCESIFGAATQENMDKTRNLLNSYYTKQREVIDLLESARDGTFVPAKISDKLREYLRVGDTHVGIVRNFAGFYRLFVLEDLTRARTGRIRRQAGNCIIQGGAAEIFRRMLYNFHIGCCKYGIQKKITWLMTVHDELDALVDDDIDIVLLIKVLYENCTIRYEGHIPYYIGINFGANWADAKSDDRELPVIMVQRMIAAYDAGKFSIPCDGHQASHLMVLKKHYMCDRLYEELHAILPDLGPGYMWTEEKANTVDAEFSNYVVRAYLGVFSRKGASLLEQLQDWQRAREEYGFTRGFLSEKLVDYRSAELDLDLEGLDEGEGGLDLGLGLELFDNTSEEELMFGSDNVMFNENNLFDDKLLAEQGVLSEEDAHFVYMRDEPYDQEDLYEINTAPTNSFDLFVSKKYVRQKVFISSENLYSAMTSGTDYHGKERVLAKELRAHLHPGADIVIIIGREMVKVSGVQCSSDEMDWLDKKLCGTLEG